MARAAARGRPSGHALDRICSGVAGRRARRWPAASCSTRAHSTSKARGAAAKPRATSPTRRSRPRVSGAAPDDRVGGPPGARPRAHRRRGDPHRDARARGAHELAEARQEREEVSIMKRIVIGTEGSACAGEAVEERARARASARRGCDVRLCAGRAERPARPAVLPAAAGRGDGVRAKVVHEVLEQGGRSAGVDADSEILDGAAGGRDHRRRGHARRGFDRRRLTRPRRRAQRDLRQRLEGARRTLARGRCSS